MVTSTTHHQSLFQTNSKPAGERDSAHPYVTPSGSDEWTGVFIRHPTELPIQFRHCQVTSRTPEPLDSTTCGLCFLSDSHVTKGAILEVSIPIRDWTYRFVGRVIRTCRLDAAHKLWVCFGSQADAFQARMAEQMCHIEVYRDTVRKREGRTISSELAAREWVAKYAACFPAGYAENHDGVVI